MAYIVSVSGSSFKIEVVRTNTTSTESVFDLVVDGNPIRVSAVEVGDPSHLSLIINNRSYDVVMEEDIVSVEGLSFRVEVEDELKKKIAKGVEKTRLKEERIEINAPMPGLVVAIKVSPGKKVSSGQGIVILEAMKMQNELKTPRDGIVQQIFVKEGMKVNGGDLLLVLE